MFDLHPTDIGRILGGLVDKKMLVSDWKGRWTTYTINKEYKQECEQLDMADVDIVDVAFKNESDRQIYNYICENGLITTAQVLTITRIGTKQGASVALKRLIKQGLVEKAGTGHGTHYILTGK